MLTLTTEPIYWSAKKINGDTYVLFFEYGYSILYKVIYKHHKIKIEIICHIHSSFFKHHVNIWEAAIVKNDRTKYCFNIYQNNIQ